jgi:hypothetical protein
MANAPIILSSSGTVITGVAGKKIRVMALAVVSLAAVGIKLQSNTTDITGVLSLAANGGIVWNAGGRTAWCETAAGEALNINISAGTTLGGVIVYEVV